MLRTILRRQSWSPHSISISYHNRITSSLCCKVVTFPSPPNLKFSHTQRSHTVSQYTMATTEPTAASELSSAAYEGIPSEKANALHTTRTKNNEPHYGLPDAKTLEEAGNIMIQDEAGKQFPFKELYQNKKGQQLIVFIRHFFCGVCNTFSTAR